MYFRSIQALRFAAAMYVTLFHISYWWDYDKDFFPGLFQYGYGAIDLFFVISGFVIVKSAFALQPGWTSLLEFLKNRLGRIYPAYWLFLLLFIVTGMVDISNRTWGGFWCAFFLIPGYYKSIIVITWTLRFEMYLYLLMGLVVLNRQFKYVLFFLMGLSVMAHGANLLAPLLPNWHFPVYGLYNEFMLEIFMGVAIWKVYQKVPVGLAIILAVAGLVWFLTPIKLHTSHVLDFGIPSAMLITGLAALEFRQKIKVPEVMVLLGNASYSMYIVHVPIIMTVLKNINIQYATNKGVLLLLVLAILLLAILSYWYIEKPILRWLKEYKRKPAMVQK